MRPRTIWKYPIPCLDCFELEIPSGGIFLSVQEQMGTPTAWFYVNPSMLTEKRRFHLIGTGHDIPEIIQEKRVVGGVELESYLGTVQLSPGHLVYHLFEEKNP